MRRNSPGRSPTATARWAHESCGRVSQAERDLQAEADAALAQLTDGLSPVEAAFALAVLANRTAARLHTLSRTEALNRKEQPDWPIWAQLQNATRTMVLQASTCRDLSARLSARKP
jgi:hypothetical protein